MRSIAVLLLCPALILADEKAKPNTLTPKEIEVGWILLFDGETTFGWKAEGGTTIKDGSLVLTGNKETSVTTNASFKRFEVNFEFQHEPGKVAKLTVFGKDTPLQAQDPAPNWTRASFIVDIVAEREFKGKFALSHSFTGKQTGTMSVGPAFDDKAISTPIKFTVPADSTLTLRNIKLRPRATVSLFNGKDLAGWKVFDDPKRNASKWSVTKEGLLNVKNGPGDLQTEKKFDDFILQFECISNGKALNSGIFFRCIENQYQNGYEAQVQNGFKDDDRTKPADFGTGAIYRRIAARKVVPNDNEWFTMTVLAHGKHIATWVNGYQTVDWEDDRKENENPRMGYRSAAGHLSIQGHDVTTDLSFRNIRIAELKK